MLKPIPHLRLDVQIDVMYCDAVHAESEGAGVDHEVSRASAVLALVPPGDMQPNLHWPPADHDVTEMRKWILTFAASTIVGMLSEIPGAEVMERAREGD